MMMKIKHYTQPTGNTCGPACLMMIYEFFKTSTNHYSILEIAEFCGTDWTVGTPPEKMIKGMDKLGIRYIHHLKLDSPYDDLKVMIEKGNIPILRTMTQNVPHWIIVSGYKDGKFEIHDPWLGEIEYSETGLDEVWNPRNYECFEIPDNDLEIKQGITEEEFKDIITWAYPYFSKVSSAFGFIDICKTYSNLSISLKLVDRDDKIRGVYLLNKTKIPKKFYNDDTNEKGLEGIMLVVDESLRGMGWGNKLKDYTRTLGYDYIWGYQHKNLNNLDDWLKRRILLGEENGSYVTIETFKHD